MRKKATPAQIQKKIDEQTQKRKKAAIQRVREGIADGSITTFQDILLHVSLSSFIGNSFYTFKNKMADPRQFTYEDVMRLAKFFGCTFDDMHVFVVGQIKTLKKKR